MENSGESGEDSGSLNTSAFLAGSNIANSYISMQSDDMEGDFFINFLPKEQRILERQDIEFLIIMLLCTFCR